MANFIRKHIDPAGTYRLAFQVGSNEMGQPEIKKEIVIQGREIFSTDNKKLIEVLRKDPEIEEFEGETTIEPKGDDEE